MPGCVLGLWLSRNLEAVPRVNRNGCVGGRGPRYQGAGSEISMVLGAGSGGRREPWWICHGGYSVVTDSHMEEKNGRNTLSLTPASHSVVPAIGCTQAAALACKNPA